MVVVQRSRQGRQLAIGEKEMERCQGVGKKGPLTSNNWAEGSQACLSPTNRLRNSKVDYYCPSDFIEAVNRRR